MPCNGSYIWDTQSSFGNTSKKLELVLCTLLKENNTEGPHLEKQPNDAWVCYAAGGEKLLSVSRAETMVLIDLYDDDPATLLDRKSKCENEVKKTRATLADAIESAKHEQKEVSESTKTKISNLEHLLNERVSEREKLEALTDLWNSKLNAAIVYEVDGLKFEIARLDAVSLSQLFLGKTR